MKKSKLSRIVFALVLSCSFTSFVVTAGEIEKTCDVSITSFSCPLCGGISVTDCLDCDGFTNTDMRHKTCFKRKLLIGDSDKSKAEKHNFIWNDILGAVVWFLAAGMATACGVGGGGIYVPLGIILLRFAPKSASGLSQCSIFGASLGGLILNAMATHPKTNIRDTVSNLSDEEYLAFGGKYYSRPRIDYDMALFLAPMEMAGAVLGVIIQKIIPNWLYLLTACCILGFTAHKTFIKYMSANEAEKVSRALIKTKNATKTPELAYRTSEESDSDESITEDSQMISVPFPLNKVNPVNYLSIEAADPIEERRKFLEYDTRQYPKEKICGLILLWLGLIFITFMKGGKGVESLVGITCQSPWYYVLLAFEFVWTFAFSAVCGRKLMQQQKARDKVGYPSLACDVKWDLEKLKFYGTFTFIAGIVAGLIGIGGGMVLGPIMLIMGIHPIVSSATTATMIVLTSSSVAVLFITSGMVPWDYATFFFSICFTGALVGKKYIDDYVKKSGKASLLILILASIIGLSTVGCFYIAVSGLSANNWCFDGMKSFCQIPFASKHACPISTGLASEAL